MEKNFEEKKEQGKKSPGKKKSAKKFAALAIGVAMTAALFTGCGGGSVDDDADGKTPITVIARETGSGTRDAFNELMGITTDGTDNTTPYAEISQSTAVVMTTVAGNEKSIGYISLGSLNDSVKAIRIDGKEASVSNIKDGSYAAARSFLIVTKDGNGVVKEQNELAADFIEFILSSSGQSIISEEGYITVEDNAAEYTQRSDLEGKLVVAGSTSVAPVMQSLADAYKALNENVTVEIQQTGSGAGITSTVEGACDIGMSSRELKDEEIAEGLTGTKIAMDGIAVVVNKGNSVDDLTSEAVRQIFTGEITDWSAAQ